MKGFIVTMNACFWAALKAFRFLKGLIMHTCRMVPHQPFLWTIRSRRRRTLKRSKFQNLFHGSHDCHKIAAHKLRMAASPHTSQKHIFKMPSLSLTYRFPPFFAPFLTVSHPSKLSVFFHSRICMF